MAFGFQSIPKKIGFIGQPTTQPQAQAGLPLIIQQLYHHFYQSKYQ